MATKQPKAAPENKIHRLSDESHAATGREAAGLVRLYGNVGIAAVAAAARYHNKSKIAGGDAPRRSVHAR